MEIGGWRWTPEGLLVGPLRFTWKGNPGEKELMELGASLSLESEVWSTLQNGTLAFANGTADYRGAYENLQELVRGRREARNAVLSIFDEIDRSFEPSGPLSQLAQADLRERTELAAQAIQKLIARAKAPAEPKPFPLPETKLLSSETEAPAAHDQVPAPEKL